MLKVAVPVSFCGLRPAPASAPMSLNWTLLYTPPMVALPILYAAPAETTCHVCADANPLYTGLDILSAEVDVGEFALGFVPRPRSSGRARFRMTRRGPAAHCRI